MLDCEEHDLPGVAYRVVEQMVISELIRPKDRVTVMRALLLRHRHVNEHERFRFGMKKASVSYTSLQVCGGEVVGVLLPIVYSHSFFCLTTSVSIHMCVPVFP